MRLQTTALSFILAAGCAAQHSDPNILPPNAGLRPVSRVPAGGATPFNAGTGFTFTGPTAPGNATFTDANVSNGPQVTPTGTGSIDVTIAGTNYSSSAFQTALMTGLTDPQNVNYIALGGYYLYGSGSDQYASSLFVIVKQSDFALNTPIALDGVDRVAMFGNGLATAQQPSVNGAAITGDVTFTAGSLTGSTVNANVTGDFGPIAIVGGGSGSGSGSGSGTITAGSYTLAYQGPAQVSCTGTLVGHEADFASVSMANLGLVGGSVTVTTPSSSVTDVAGAVIGSAFGSTPLALDLQSGSPGIYAATTTGSGSGPDSTTVIGMFLAFDGADATATFINAAAGQGYVASDGTSTCTVSYGASLTSP